MISILFILAILVGIDHCIVVSVRYFCVMKDTKTYRLKITTILLHGTITRVSSLARVQSNVLLLDFPGDTHIAVVLRGQTRGLSVGTLTCLKFDNQTLYMFSHLQGGESGMLLRVAAC